MRFCANKAIISRDGNNFDIHDSLGQSKLSRMRYNQVIKDNDSKANQVLNSLNKKKEPFLTAAQLVSVEDTILLVFFRQEAVKPKSFIAIL